jgi:hypothetical protein
VEWGGLFIRAQPIEQPNQPGPIAIPSIPSPSFLASLLLPSFLPSFLPYLVRRLAHLQELKVRVHLEVPKQLAQPQPLLPQQPRALRRARGQAARGGAENLGFWKESQSVVQRARSAFERWRRQISRPVDQSMKN